MTAMIPQTYTPRMIDRLRAQGYTAPSLGDDYNLVTHHALTEPTPGIEGKRLVSFASYAVKLDAPDDLGERTLDPIRVRWYKGLSRESSAFYCYVWMYPPKGTRFGWDSPTAWEKYATSGKGRATGGGYNMKIASLSAAFDAAGIRFAVSFDGEGEHAENLAIMAVADWMGLPLDGLIVRD
jgi:hypothetical protein